MNLKSFLRFWDILHLIVSQHGGRLTSLNWQWKVADAKDSLRGGVAAMVFPSPGRCYGTARTSVVFPRLEAQWWHPMLETLDVELSMNGGILKMDGLFDGNSHLEMDKIWGYPHFRKSPCHYYFLKWDSPFLTKVSRLVMVIHDLDD